MDSKKYSNMGLQRDRVTFRHDRPNIAGLAIYCRFEHFHWRTLAAGTMWQRERSATAGAETTNPR